MKGLGKDIGPHLLGGAVLEIEFTCIMKMTNEEVFGFDMFGPLGAGNIAIVYCPDISCGNNGDVRPGR